MKEKNAIFLIFYIFEIFYNIQTFEDTLYFS